MYVLLLHLQMNIQAYFGGAAQCEDGAGDHAYKEEELVCPACSGPQHVQVNMSFLSCQFKYGTRTCFLFDTLVSVKFISTFSINSKAKPLLLFF